MYPSWKRLQLRWEDPKGKGSSFQTWSHVSSLEFGLGEKPVWGVQGSGGWVSLFGVTSGSSAACSGCGPAVAAAPSLGHRSCWDEPSPEALISLLEQSRDGRTHCPTRIPASGRGQSPGLRCRWSLAGLCKPGPALKRSCLAVWEGSEVLWFGVSARRAGLWSEAWGEGRL